MQLLTVTNMSRIGLNKAIEGRYQMDSLLSYMIYSTLSKPAADGSCPEEDVVRITSDPELEDFLVIAEVVYSPVWLQVQLHKPDSVEALQSSATLRARRRLRRGFPCREVFPAANECPRARERGRRQKIHADNSGSRCRSA